MTSGHLEDSAGRLVEMVGAGVAALVEPHDVIGTIARMLRIATGLTQAAGAGVIMRRAGEARLQLLVATSHRAEELELYQAQQETGPCFEAVESGRQITARAQEMDQRWPRLSAAFARAGYHGVQSTPVRWHGDVLGALNLFWSEDSDAPVRQPGLGTVFADLTALTIIHNDPVSAEQVRRRTLRALDSRTLIEQAKGVMAVQRGLSMDEAYTALVEESDRSGQVLSVVAAEVVDRAAGR